MSVEEQEKIIEQLRRKAIRIEVSDNVKATDKADVIKIDKRIVWEKAERAGKTIHDDDLPTKNPTGT